MSPLALTYPNEPVALPAPASIPPKNEPVPSAVTDTFVTPAVAIVKAVPANPALELI